MSLFDRFRRKKAVENPPAKSFAKREAAEEKYEGKSKKSASSKKEVSLKPGVARVDQGAEGGERKGYIILRPRITEKASYITADGGYTFDVAPHANKVEIRQAIEEIFSVKPVRVNIIQVPSKRVFTRGKAGFRPGGKKAIVFLKEGERIEFV